MSTSSSYTIPVFATSSSDAEGNGEVVRIDDMPLRARERLIAYFRKPRNFAFLDAIVDQVQELEVAASQLYNDTRLSTAVGVNLDVLGRVVGELRAGRADEDYRAAIRTRILVNRSNGRLEDLIAIVLSLLPAAVITVAEYQPPAVSFQVDSLGSVTFDTVYRLLAKAKPCGVRLEFTAGLGTIGSDDDTTLGFTMSSTA